MDKSYQESLFLPIPKDIKNFADRSSSLVTFYPYFDSFSTDHGQIRFIQTSAAWIGANEPLSPHMDRRKMAHDFFEHAHCVKKMSALLPVGENLSYLLQKDGFFRHQIGINPIFDLEDFFFDEPLKHLAIARSLKARGAEIIELVGSQKVDNCQMLINISHEWLGQNQKYKFYFLNPVDVLQNFDLKRLFVLKIKNEIQAFISALPIYDGGKLKGYYFFETCRRSSARSSSMELLMIETMRILYLEKCPEVHLGMCPLAEIRGVTFAEKILQKVYQHWTWGYNFKGLHQFKLKLRPTRFERLYMVTNTSSPLIWAEVVKANINPHFQLRPFVYSVLSKIKCTLIFSFSFYVLHWLRLQTEYFHHLFLQSSYRASDVTLLGLFVGPLFHNHWFHLNGDQLSFIFFGAIVEYFYGKKIFLSMTAAGLWLSNPLTHFILWVMSLFSMPQFLQSIYNEIDYGSSNAVYAFVGAVAAKIPSPLILLLPFTLSGVVICVQKESVLAIHHLVSLYLSYFMIKFFSPNTRPLSPHQPLQK